jgi:hypothetical protein
MAFFEEIHMQHTKWFAIGVFAIVPLLGHADDWACEVVLCLANPQGATAVSECVPPIRKLWRELAKGHAFPTCNMNTGDANGNSASHSWASGSNCLAQYLYWGGIDGSELMCKFNGVVTIKIASQLHTRVWWNVNESLTEDYSQRSVMPASAAPQEFQPVYASALTASGN